VTVNSGASLVTLNTSGNPAIPPQWLALVTWHYLGSMNNTLKYAEQRSGKMLAGEQTHLLLLRMMDMVLMPLAGEALALLTCATSEEVKGTFCYGLGPFGTCIKVIPPIIHLKIRHLPHLQASFTQQHLIKPTYFFLDAKDNRRNSD